MALQLAEAGFNIAVHYASSEDAARQVAGEIREFGVQAATFGADVADAAACADLVKRVTAELGPVGVLVNNAGITRDTLALRMKEDDWQAVLDTNLSAAFHLSKAALRGMLRQEHSRIINISSVVGLTGNVGQANYVAAKAGLAGLTKALAQEYGGRGITVNAVAPGFIESDMTAGLDEELRSSYLARIPAGRFGTPAEVAALVTFLASPAAAYINGQTITVDGGMVMR
jgi:3-oxoacyl-[acyl-carrier protein] reductase